MNNPIVWTPPQELVGSSAMTRFIDRLRAQGVGGIADYESLHRWSVHEPQAFWQALVDFVDIKGDGELSPIYNTAEGPTPLAKSWFPKFQLNFAENLLQGADDRTAVISWSEARLKRTLSLGQLRAATGGVQGYLRSVGITSTDRVFAYLPNIPEAITCMLAVASLGAAWGSCGTDYQLQGLLVRAERVKPRVLVAARKYAWRGGEVDLTEVITKLVDQVASIEHVILVDYLEPDSRAPIDLRTGVSLRFYSALMENAAALDTTVRFPFSQPLYLMFSSGTTGTPKGIVHGAGGTLLEHKKEMTLHSDIRKGDRFFYQTSTSWMMWNWLVSGMASGARVILYDGDPFCESGEVLWRLADTERVTHFGTSAAYLSELCKRKIEPATRVSLSDLRAIFSTGSVLAPELFDYVSRSIKRVWLQSISGGSDIIGCFGLGSPLLPVYRGEVQCKSLGYDVAVFNPQGVRVVEEQGELVCAAPAPSMPLNLLDDPDGASYQAAYFADYPGIWRHGDFVRETAHGGLVFGGRSDATLKPGGVRISTAEIYAALQRVQRVQQALAVGYASNGTTSEQIVLFVLLGIGDRLDKDLECEIRCALKQSNLFYLPAVIIQAPDLPRTPNNKLAELTVKRVLHGHDPGNISALVNPECLEFFVRVTSELQSHLKNPKPV